MELPIIVLQHLDFHQYLDFKCVIEFSKVSRLTLEVVFHHIQNNLSFNTPLFSLLQASSSSSPPKFLKIYKNSKKICNKLPIQLYSHIKLQNLHSIYPPKFTHYKIFMQPNDPFYFPSSITHLCVVGGTDQRLLKKKIMESPKFTHLAPPSLPSLSHLALKKTCVYSEIHKFISLSSSLTHLQIEHYLEGDLPHLPLLTNLSFGDLAFLDSPVNSLPSTLKILKLGNSFNQPVDLLPPSLVYLKFGDKFNQPVLKLPQSLKKLHFGYSSYCNCDFNNDLSLLPSFLTHLILKTNNFRHDLNNLPQGLVYFSFSNISKTFITILKFLPSNLKYLHLDALIEINVQNLPESITHLTLPTKESRCVNYSPPYLFSSLSHLIFLDHTLNRNCYYTDNLPLSITTIRFSDLFNSPVDYLPPNIHKITFGQDFNQRVDHLPSSLEKLIFGYLFNQPIDYLPDSLTYLYLGADFNQNIDYLPTSLKEINFSPYMTIFNEAVDHLPPSLEKIGFGQKFNKNIDHLPSSLLHIRFGLCFNQPVDNLPKNLSSLIFLRYRSKLPPSPLVSDIFTHPVDHLPPNLTSLSFGNALHHAIDNLPLSLKNLSFYTHAVADTLPSDCLNHLPKSLESLAINYTNLSNVNMSLLPETLTKLDLSDVENFDFSNLNYLPNICTITGK